MGKARIRGPLSLYPSEDIRSIKYLNFHGYKKVECVILKPFGKKATIIPLGTACYKYGV